jgi:hypothetical protein
MAAIADSIEAEDVVSDDVVSSSSAVAAAAYAPTRGQISSVSADSTLADVRVMQMQHEIQLAKMNANMALQAARFEETMKRVELQSRFDLQQDRHHRLRHHFTAIPSRVGFEHGDSSVMRVQHPTRPIYGRRLQLFAVQNPTMPHATAVVVDGVLHVMGGWAEDCDYDYLSSVERYTIPSRMCG